MDDASIIEERIRKEAFLWMQFGTTLAALPVGFLWMMSPLGLGFASWPNDPTLMGIARGAYWLSFFVGLPLLAIGQVGGLVLSWRGRALAGACLSAATLALLIATAGAVLLLLELGT